MKNNLKNFFEDIILEIKNKLFSSKYVKDENIFKDMQKKYRYYKNFRISGKIENKQDFQNGALTFECKFISKNNKCLIYPIRPIFCRDYPNINPELIYNGVEMLDECGFYFDVNKKFEEYLN